MTNIVDTMEQIQQILSNLKVEVDPNEDKTIHHDIHEFYLLRISECIALGMKDVALAYHEHINKDVRLGEYEKTVLLLKAMELF